MAGSYPDVPNDRLSWDRDGTLACWFSGVVEPAEFTEEQRRKLNSEAGLLAFQLGTGLAGETGGVGWIAFIFPAQRTISHYWLLMRIFDNAAATALAYSNDTTNGLDGAWTTIVNPYTFDTTDPIPEYRTNIVALASPVTCKAIRFGYDASTGSDVVQWYHVHLFGDFAAGAQPDRLDLWDPVADAALGPAALDWGDTTQGSASTRTFRVKNRSATKTAGAVTLTRESLNDPDPSWNSQRFFSLDAVTWSTSLAIGDLAPGEISDVVHYRRTTLATAESGLQAGRIIAAPTTFA